MTTPPEGTPPLRIGQRPAGDFGPAFCVFAVDPRERQWETRARVPELRDLAVADLSADTERQLRARFEGWVSDAPPARRYGG